MSNSHKNAPGASDAPRAGAHSDDDEVVHVPKGKSKLRFLLTLGLMLFVLVIFTVGDQLMGTFGRGPSNDTDYMTWNHPTDGVQRMSYPDFVTAKRAIDNFFSAQGQRAGRDQTEDDHISYLLITDRLARDAGIDVPKAELARMLREGQPGLVQPFFTAENYKAALSARGVSPKEFEGTLSWLMRVTRYEGLMAFALGTPDPDAIETAWKAQHQQYAFDLVGTQRDDFMPQAALESPDDAALEVWFDALSDQERGSLFGEFYSPDRISVALISWAPGSALPAALLERFPAPESSDPALAARSYYDMYSQVRYLRPAAGEDADGSDEDSSATDEGSALRDQLYLPFEEVAEAAGDEARVLAALSSLLADVRGRRAAGEEIDLAALATELGLTFDSDGLPRSQVEWTELVGPQLASAMRSPGTGKLLRTPVVGATGQYLAEVLENVPPTPPLFADIPTEARAAWSKRRAGELALAQLEDVYTGLVAASGIEPEEGAELPPSVDVGLEAFTAALSDAGLSAQHIDWFDPSRAKVEEAEDPAQRYLLNNYIAGYGGPYYSLADGLVTAPANTFDGDSVWMLRSLGARDPERIEMRPAEYVQLQQTATFTGASAVYAELSDMAKRFGLAYPGRAAQDAQDS